MSHRNRSPHKHSRSHRKHSRSHRRSPIWWVLLAILILMSVVALLIYGVSQL